jgi:hypothetical protein
MESIFKMAILRSPISPSEPCIFAIFKPINFKFMEYMEKNKKTVFNLKNWKWRMNSIWRRKHFFLIKISKMIILQKNFFAVFSE